MKVERVAVVSDIHGNVRALDEVLADITGRGIDRIVNLGDCLYGPFDPKPAANRLLEADWPTVTGNEDRILLEALEGHPVSRMARWTADLLGREHLDWLAGLPSMRTIEGIARVFHGTPIDEGAYLLTRPTAEGAMRPATDAEIAERLGPTDEALILCGHDHLPRVVRLPDGRTIVNPGSVGCPAYTDAHPIPHRVESRTPHARYAIVHWDGSTPSAELITISYDWDAAAAEADANGFPDWASWLRTGEAS